VVPDSQLNTIKVRSYYNDALVSQYANRAKYGGRFMVTILPGDGIGPEMVKHVSRMFKYAFYVTFLM